MNQAYYSNNETFLQNEGDDNISWMMKYSTVTSSLSIIAYSGIYLVL